MKLKDVVLTAIAVMCLFLYFGKINLERRIDAMESTVGNQRVALQEQEKENKSLSDQIDALNKKVDELPK